MKNNNQAFVRDLALQNLKNNKLRNLFTVLAIVLSVSLLMGLTLSYTAMNESTKKQINQMQHVIYYRVTPEQIEVLEKDERIAELYLFKQGQSMEIENFMVVPRFYEQKGTKMLIPRITEGNYPQAENEIAVDKSYMAQIGKAAALGARLSFQFLDGSQEEFIISGYTDTGMVSNVYNLLFSQSYAINGSQLKEHNYHVAVRIVGAERMSDQEFLETIRSIGSDCGIQRQHINENNIFVLSLSSSFGDVLLLITLFFIILLVSFLVIYSVFYISVVGRTQLFGQLRTLGATKKQVKRIVRQEGLLLCLLGAPLGLVMGALYAYFIRPDGWNWKTTLLIGCIVWLADLLTVLISVGKPADLAAKVSPIEALRTNMAEEDIKRFQRTVKVGSLSPWHLARLNVKRNRKKAVLTILSLCLGGILFMAGTSMITSINQEEYSRQGNFKHGEYFLSLSENAAQTNPFGMTGVQAQGNPMNQELFDRISKIEGVKTLIPLEKLAVKFDYKGIRSDDSINPFNQAEAELLRSGLKEGSLDYERMVANKEILVVLNNMAKEIYGWQFEIGDSINLRWYDGKEEVESSFTIAGSVDYSPENYLQVYSAGWFLAPEPLIREMMVEGFNLTRNLIVSVSDFQEQGAKVEQQLQSIVDESPLLKMATLREGILQDQNSFRTLYSFVLGITCFIISFSLINLINTLITNVLTRKREFAMLQSIGMDQRQLTLMIQGEGLLLTLWNLLLTVSAGTACGYIFILIMKSYGADYMHYSFPIWYFLLYAALITLSPILISALSIKLFQKKALVERLREVE